MADWLAGLLANTEVMAAVDGRTSKQARDDNGNPIHVLNVLAHDLRLCLASGAVGDGKPTDPQVLKAHLDELFAAYPGLRILTGDALFCQRPLARAIVESGRDYLRALKNSPPEWHEAARTAFAATAATTRENNAVV